MSPLSVATCTPEAAFDFVAKRLAALRGGARRPVCYLPGNAGRIDAVERQLFEHPVRFRGVDVFQALALGPAQDWERAVMRGVGIVTPFIGPGVRELVNAGLARNIRCNLSQVPRLFDDRWRPDVAFAHTSPPDAQGRVTLGLNAGLDIAPVQQAHFKVAFVNVRMPRWHIETVTDTATGQHHRTGCAMALSDFDLVVPIDESLLEHRMAGPDALRDESTRRIAAHLVDWLRRDAVPGDANALPHVLQLGIGRIPDALAAALGERGLSVSGIWSELLSDGVLGLYRAGLIRRNGGPALRDRIVVGFVLGTRALYEAMHENPSFAVMPQSVVNDPTQIRHNARMTSINSALAVSLAGEVSAATIRKRYYSDVGGQLDFALGATWASGGQAVIALPSVVRLRDGSFDSRIVAAHAEGAHHTIGADLPVVVVTEQGAADLRGLHDAGRVEAMLRVAHPEWRDQLTKDARSMPSLQGVGAEPPHLVRLHDGRSAVLRAAGPDDIEAIAKYIGRLSSDDRRTRYMGTVSLDALTSDERLQRLYDQTLDYREHAAFIAVLDIEVIGVAHAYRVGASGTYEISFSRRSDLVAQGIGAHLMRMLVDWAVRVGATDFYATTYRTRNPRMRSLFDALGFAVSPDPDDRELVIYRARVRDLAGALAEETTF
jgi:acyl-CoA hydrolase/RimJ/RimL family protein N-acetyltransferase